MYNIIIYLKMFSTKPNCYSCLQDTLTSTYIGKYVECKDNTSHATHNYINCYR